MKSRRLLEALLRLYPPGFRERYEEEMRELIRSDRSQGRRTSGLALVGNAALAWAGAARRALGRGSLFDLRSFRRTRSFVAIVIPVVAVSVALTVAACGLVRGTLLRPPFYPEPERLVFAWGSNPSNGQLRDVVSGPVFVELRRQARTLSALAAFHPASAVATRDGRPRVLDALEVSVDFLRVIGVPPALGGDFGDEHRSSGGEAAVILSHAFWRDELGGDPDAIGRTVDLNRAPHTIVGVMSPEFELLGPTDVLLPLREDVLASEDRTFYNYWLVGRLASGAGAGAAARELSAVLAAIAVEDPRLSGWSVLVEPVAEISVAAARPLLLLLVAAVALVGLAAATNLAGLNLVRTLGRARELSVRTALGARPLDVAKLMIVETGVLAAVGAAAGLVLGLLLLRWLAGIVPPAIPIPGSAATVHALRSVFDLDVAVAGATAAILIWLLMTLPSVLARALRGLRVVVAIEIALATVLLVGAGLLSRAAERLLAVDPGVDPEKLLTFYIGELDEPDPWARARYFREVVRRIEDVPGIVRAGATDYAPFQGEDDFMGFRLPDRPPPERGRGPREEWRRVTEGFFETAGIAVLRGRTFEARDFEVPPQVAVVNEAFARKYWPGDDPLGRRMRIALPAYELVEVVGVVEDVPDRGPAVPPPPMFFAPLQGQPRDNMAIFVRVEGDPGDALPAVRAAAWSVDSSQPIDREFPMNALLEGTVSLPRLARTLVGHFAALALGLAALGIFAVTSYTTRTRRAELGLRLALGATHRDLRWLLAKDVARMAASGLAAGALAGVGGAFVVRSLLHGVSPVDPWTLVLAATLMAAVAVLATYVPARSVVRIDPARTIRAL